MSAPSGSLFSRVKNIVTDNRNRLHATANRSSAILKARGSLRDELSIIANLFQDVVNRDVNKDVSVADDTIAADDDTSADAGDASSAKSSAALINEEFVPVSSDDE